jgi:hypothetical protein
MECIEQVRAQTYRPLEHCIVSDGPDPELARLMQNEHINEMEAELFRGRHKTRKEPSGVPIKFVELGRNWSSFLTLSFSAAPFQVAQWLASGDMLMWLSDDQLITPDHVEKLVALMEEKRADFVYPVHGYWAAGDRRKTLRIAGYDPPREGQISHALYRVELLDYMGFTTHVGCGTDWHQIQAWMAAGARWAMLPERTFAHRIDRIGDAGQPRGRLLLRGHEEP